MSITPEQFKVVATIPMVTGSISVIGSAAIIFMIFRSTEKLKTTYHRILFGMSLLDIIFSIGCLLSTIPFPSDTPLPWGMLYGNTTTCTIQGMMLFSGSIGCTMYNCSLAMFYMLKIAFGIKDEQMKKRIEPFFHCLPLLYLISTNTFLLSKQSFNPLGAMCLITPYPRGCNLNPDVPCTRGEHANEYFWNFAAWPVIGMFGVIFLAMGRLYYAVRAQEIKMRKYQLSIDTPDGVGSLRRRVELRRASNNTIPQPPSELSVTQKILMKFMPSYDPQGGRDSDTREVNGITRRTSTTATGTSLAQKRREAMIQCFLYVSAYFISYIFVIAHQLAIKSGKLIYPFWVLSSIFFPLQGFLNFVVFIRPRIMGYREADSELSFRQAFSRAILSTGATTATMIQRRSSLMNTQANGGTRYTAREFHMLVSSRKAENKLVGKENENIETGISHVVKESEDSSVPDDE